MDEHLGAAEPLASQSPSGLADGRAEDTDILVCSEHAADVLIGERCAICDIRAALRMCARELAEWRCQPEPDPDPSEADVDDIVAEFTDKARGFPPADQENPA